MSGENEQDMNEAVGLWLGGDAGNSPVNERAGYGWGRQSAISL